MAGTFNLNDKVIMKKPHACGTNEWQITRMGVDIKIKCILWTGSNAWPFRIYKKVKKNNRRKEWKRGQLKIE